MKRLAAVFLVMALVFMGTALFIKLVSVGRVMPGPMPINWIKLTDTFLLFSIAVSLLALNRKSGN